LDFYWNLAQADGTDEDKLGDDSARKCVQRGSLSQSPVVPADTQGTGNIATCVISTIRLGQKPHGDETFNNPDKPRRGTRSSTVALAIRYKDSLRIDRVGD
jgi:hypothetical protein